MNNAVTYSPPGRALAPLGRRKGVIAPPNVRPVVRKRKCGGWLATTPKGHRLCIGVTAETARDARILYFQTVRRWLQILSADR